MLLLFVGIKLQQPWLQSYPHKQQQHFDTELPWETPVNNAHFAAADVAVVVSVLDLGAV